MPSTMCSNGTASTQCGLCCLDREIEALEAKVERLQAYPSAMKAVAGALHRRGHDDGTQRWNADNEIRKAFAEVHRIAASAAKGE